MTLDRWRSATDDRARVHAAAVAARVGAPQWTLERSEAGPVALFRLGGREFALVPGGPAELGVDPAAFRPTAEQAASYARSVEEFGFPADLAAHLARVLAPRRSVLLPSFLMSVEPAEADGERGWDDGVRLPTPDEWEYACGAGARTLFRWGDGHPATADPFSAPDGPHLRANAFGLRIARDPYRPELTSEPGVVCGGDGGEATCGGYGSFLAWLPLAPAFRDPGLAELLDEEDFLGRAVIDLR